MLRVLLWLACLAPGCFIAGRTAILHAEEKVARKVEFVRDIQPLFRKHCYSCHGVEEQQAGLRLDIRKRAFDGGDSGAVIKPGSAAKSRLIAVVKGVDEDTGVMPPEDEGTPLKESQIALLQAWIDQGAAWPAAADNNQKLDHWSFKKITCPAPPPAASTQIRNGIDAFVYKKLADKGIKPSPVADRHTLIRRLYLDVLGLPPSPAEVAAFVSDDSLGAYELLVEQVLQSRHYGERWGRHWLDLARYADTDGYEKDRTRPFAWRYRQWVIDALNRDMPFDQFSTNQLAGDMLPGATDSDRIATGFHRNTLHNTEGGVDREEDRVKKTVDRINTTGAIWMGLTVGCAQCHSHKYDPLTQREYYSLYSLLNNMDERDITAITAAEAAELTARRKIHAVKLKTLEATLSRLDDERNQVSVRWEKKQNKQDPNWLRIVPGVVRSKNGATLRVLPDGSVRATVASKAPDEYEVQFQVLGGPGFNIQAIKLEVLSRTATQMGEPESSTRENLVSSEISGSFNDPELEALLQSTGREDEIPPPQIIQFEFARATFSQNGREKATGMRQVAIFKLAKPLTVKYDGVITLNLKHHLKGESNNIGRFRLSMTLKKGQIPAREPISAELSKYLRGIDSQRTKLASEIKKHILDRPSAKASKARAVVERGSPRQAYVHLRGDFLSKGDEVEPGGPAFLPALQPRGPKPDRLDLARWLFAAENPLTARVTVNRIWQRYFGRGLVRTTDDFGLQGEKPSHPQLLDWLACQLRDNGWSLKHIHRLILNSATYRQSSKARPELEDIDPLNTLLASQPRRRVEAEIIRDLALASSGLLSRKVGGPSVRPRQPAGYASLTYAGSAKWATSKGEDAYRRGLYTFFQRTSPYPMLMTFDSPDATVCIAQRSGSNTPLQALTIWNDPVFFEAAQALGRRIVTETPAKDETAGNLDRRRLEHAFLLTLSRKPDDVETKTLLKTLNRQRKISDENPTAASALCGTKPLPNGAGREELSAWIVVARVLLNLDEFITRE